MTRALLDWFRIGDRAFGAVVIAMAPLAAVVALGFFGTN